MLGEVVEDRYRIEAELGEGAMGRVYRARHVKVGREVALKVMHRDHANVPAIMERFAREAMIAARLRHPNVVAVLDVGTMPDHSPMIVLELAPGRKLSQLIDGPLARDRVVAIVRQLLCGLEHAHAAGLIHRDLKPDNILVETTPDGSEIPRIVDFGIAVTRVRDDSVAGRRITEANTIIGTPFYMSPEQALGKELDERTDLFSLGVIVYELLAGVLPCDGDRVDVVLAAVAKDPPAIADRAGVHVDPLLEAFARKLMARRREQRFQSAREALAMLELVERDRLAATKALAGAPSVEPQAESTAPRLFAAGTNSDAVCTQAMTSASRVAAEPRRRRGLAALAAAVAAVVVACVIATSVVRPRGVSNAQLDVPMVDVTVVDRVEVEHQLVVRDRAALVQRAPAVIAQGKRSAVVAPTRQVVAPAHQVIAPAREVVEPVEPEVAHDEVTHDEVAQDDSAANVAARYIAVGRALRGAPDELWQRYRRIRINDALATADSRRAALATLDAIERALP